MVQVQARDYLNSGKPSAWAANSQLVNLIEAASAMQTAVKRLNNPAAGWKLQVLAQLIEADQRLEAYGIDLPEPMTESSAISRESLNLMLTEPATILDRVVELTMQGKACNQFFVKSAALTVKMAIAAICDH